MQKSVIIAERNRQRRNLCPEEKLTVVRGVCLFCIQKRADVNRADTSIDQREIIPDWS
jgi:radical SAM superfamily enzyme